MPKIAPDTKQKKSRRALISWLGLLACSYPLIRFVLHTVPKKPVYVEIDKKIPADGALLTDNFILFDRDGSCWALSRRCTHLGCKLNYFAEHDILECPCHQSRFNPRTGEVERGPANKKLAFLPVEKKEQAPYYVVTT